MVLCWGYPAGLVLCACVHDSFSPFGGFLVGAFFILLFHCNRVPERWPVFPVTYPNIEAAAGRF